MKWLPLVWIDPRYEVSSTGLVRSWANKSKGRNSTPKMLRQAIDKDGYRTVTIYCKGKPKRCRVNRLVLRAFTGTFGAEGNHKNGVVSDNRLRNLEWSSRSANNLHAYRVLGRKPSQLGRKGAAHVAAKRVAQISANGRVVKIWGSLIDAAHQGGFNASGISGVCRGEHHTHGGYAWRLL